MEPADVILAALAVRVHLVDEGDLPIVVRAPSVREGLVHARVPLDEVETLERLATARLRHIASGETASVAGGEHGEAKRWAHAVGLEREVQLVLQALGYSKDTIVNSDVPVSDATVPPPSEQRYELAMAASESGYWDWHVATDRYFVSPRAFELLAVEPTQVSAPSPGNGRPPRRTSWSSTTIRRFAG